MEHQENVLSIYMCFIRVRFQIYCASDELSDGASSIHKSEQAINCYHGQLAEILYMYCLHGRS